MRLNLASNHRTHIPILVTDPAYYPKAGPSPAAGKQGPVST